MSEKIVVVQDKLTPRERSAYEFLVKANQPRLSPTLSSQLYELFLAGKSCEEIVRLNPGISLGQVVRARVEDNWDERKERHTTQLMDGIRERVQHSTIENVAFLSDLLAATRKYYGDKIAKYLQTGNVDDLGATVNLIGSMKAFKETAELMMKMTGQESTKAEIIHRHTVDQPVPTETTLSEEQAAQILAIFDSKEKKNE